MNALLLLYALFGIMLLLALAMLSVPYLMEKKSFFSFVLLGSLIILLSSQLYRFSSNQTALAAWLTHGKQHYQLMEKFNQLGGVDGIITRIETKLRVHPNDAQGWMILGKLYLSKQEEVKAQAAFQKAREILSKHSE